MGGGARKPFVEEMCDFCDLVGHPTKECPAFTQSKSLYREQVNAMGAFCKPNNSPFSETYNPGWRNHPNFGWRNDNPNSQPPQAPHQSFPQAPTNYGPPPGHSYQPHHPGSYVPPHKKNEDPIQALTQRISHLDQVLQNLQNSQAQLFQGLQA